MARFRRKSKGGGGGGGGKTNAWTGFIGVVMGGVALMICLIMYGIFLTNYDTAYTAAAGYTWQTGLTSIMGIWPMVIFLVVMAVGLAAVAGGTMMSVKKTLGGSWIDVFMGVVTGVVTLIIVIIIWGIVNTQFNTTAVAINATTNVASFSGIVSIIGIWPMITFLAMMASGIAQIGAAGYASYSHLRGRIT